MGLLQRVPTLKLGRSFIPLIALLAATQIHVVVVAQDTGLEEATALYKQARYVQALSLFEGLADDALVDHEARFLAHKMAVKSNILLGRGSDAEHWMTAWVAFDPDRAMADPDLDSPPFVRLYYRARKAWNERNYCPAEFRSPDPCQYREPKTRDPGITTIALFAFDDNSFESGNEHLQDGLAAVLASEISGRTELMLVEREKLDYILSEIELSQTDKVDQQSALKAGRLLGAHAFLFGEIMRIDRHARIDLRVVEVQTGRILDAVAREGRTTSELDILKLLVAMTDDVVEVLAPVARSANDETETDENELDAMLEYSRGRSALEQAYDPSTDHYDAAGIRLACEHFRRALEHDVGYEPARTRLAELEPFLASLD